MSPSAPHRAAFAVALAVCLFPFGRALAQCDDDGVFFFPVAGSVVPTNTRLILEGAGKEAKRVAALVGKELVLKSKNDAVSVKVKAGWRSEKARYAVQLVPSRPLRPNSSYGLILEPHLPGFDMIDKRGLNAPRWDTGPGADTRKPTWEVKPAMKGGEYKSEGGRITRFMKLHVAFDDQSPGYLVVSIKRAKGESLTQTYPVGVQGGEAVLGHDGCSGGFALDDGRAYKATLAGFDVAGNPAPPLTTLELHAPRADQE